MVDASQAAVLKNLLEATQMQITQEITEELFALEFLRQISKTRREGLPIISQLSAGS